MAQLNLPLHKITEAQKIDAEREITEKERVVDYNTKEYPVETIVQKYVTGLEDDTNELFIPDYQRDSAWDERRQSKFIESVLIGLPIPFIFVADLDDEAGRLEIVDGSQRIRALTDFMQDKLALVELKKLGNLNSFRYSDLPQARQRRFNRRTIRMIELSSKADEETRRDIFERINTGSVELTPMEKRRGIKDGPVLDLIEKCAVIPLFKTLAPLSETSERRREREEFVLRFFAYLNGYQKFERSVIDFLNEWIDDTEKVFTPSLSMDLEGEFVRMLDFVDQHFGGFAKGLKHTRTPRIRFEAISVGTALALRLKPSLVPASTAWAYEEEFIKLTTSDASNSRPKVIKRIEAVRNNLLTNPIAE